jgi:hypothetical protein
MKKAFLLALSAVCITVTSMAQRSPDASVSGSINGANVTIKYGSPFVKGREGKIYGTKLVPFGGEVWRAGANSATTFETDKDLTVGGQKLPAGKYSVYIKADEKEWDVIFNSQTGQWGINRDGTTTLDPSKNVITVKVKPVKKDTLQESLAYTITNKGVVLGWEYQEILIPVK